MPSSVFPGSDLALNLNRTLNLNSTVLLLLPLPLRTFSLFSCQFAAVFTGFGGRAAFKSFSLLELRSSHLSRVRV